MGLLVLIGGASVIPAAAQPIPAEPDLPAQRTELLPPREVRRAVDEAQSALSAGEPGRAVGPLRLLLEQDDDWFVGAEKKVSSRAWAIRQLRELPKAERDTYETLHGAEARAKLTRAIKQGDERGLAEIVRRSPTVSAGREAQVVLAMAARDRGDFLLAIRLLDDVLADPLTSDRTSLQLQQVLCWMLVGDESRARGVLATFAETPEAARPRSPLLDGTRWPTNDAEVGLWLQQLVARFSDLRPVALKDWQILRGVSLGNSAGPDITSAGGPAWEVRLTALDKLTMDPTRNDLLTRTVDGALKKLDHELTQLRQPRVPTARALVAGNRVIVRTPNGLAALDAANGRLLWRRAADEGPLLAALKGVAADDEPDAEKPDLTSLLAERWYRDATFGGLTSDGESVFALEGLSSVVQRQTVLGGIVQSPPVTQNRLVAYDLSTGMVRWELGGVRNEHPLPLSGHSFLAPPVPQGNQLLCLTENLGTVMLVVLQSDAAGGPPSIAWEQPLCTVQLPLENVPARRLGGLMPACSQGIAVCPTGTGMVVAVDLVRRQLLWSHSDEYVLANHPAMQMLAAMDPPLGRLDASPFLDGRHVILAAAESRNIACLDLLTGEPAWSIRRSPSMAVAGLWNDRLLLTRDGGLECRSLANGEPAAPFCRLPSAPAGTGVVAGDQFWLPLQGGMIAQIDLANLSIRHQLAVTEESVGSLSVGGDQLVMQGSRGVLAFSSRASIEQRIAEQFSRDPADPDALGWRAELRFQDGDWDQGIADLRASLAANENPRLTALLSRILLKRLAEHRPDWRDDARELRELSLSPAERFDALLAVADAHRKDGEYAVAFARMVESLSVLPDTPAEAADRIQITDDWRVDRRTLARGAMVRDWSRLTDGERRAAIDWLNQTKAGRAETIPAMIARADDFARIPPGDYFRAELLAALEKSPMDHVVIREWSRYQMLHSTDGARVAGQLAAAASDVSSRDVEVSRRLAETLSARFGETKLGGEASTGGAVAARILSGLGARPSAVTWPERPLDVRRTNHPQEPLRSAWVSVSADECAWRPDWAYEFKQVNLGQTSLRALNAAGQVQWEWRLPQEIDGLSRWTPIAPDKLKVLVRGPLIVFVSATYFVVGYQPERYAPPIDLWARSLVPQSDPMVVSRGGRMTIAGNVYLSPRAENMGQLLDFTIDGAIYRANGELVCAHPLTGKVHWSRRDFNDVEDLSLDRGVISLRVRSRKPNDPPNEFVLLQAVDGRESGQRTLPPEWKVWWRQGTQVLCERSSGTSHEVFLHDLFETRSVWSETSADAIRAIHVDADKSFWALRDSGRLSAYSSVDSGERSREVRVPIPPKTDRLWVQRNGSIDLAVYGTGAGVPGRFSVMGTSPDDRLVSGNVVAIDRANSSLRWSQAVEDQALALYQPRELPVLIFACRQTGRLPDGELGDRFALRVLEKSSGRTVYQTFESPLPLYCSYQAMLDRPLVELRFGEWSLTVFPTSSEDGAAIPAPAKESR